MKATPSSPQVASTRPKSRRATKGPRPRSTGGSSARALLLPCAFAVVLVVFALILPPGREYRDIFWTFWAAGGALLAWSAALYLMARRRSRTLGVEAAVHKHHWVQAFAQLSVLLYWGWHVRAVYAFLPLVLAQLIFAYAVDSLLTWSRRDTYTLGFGPFPVVLSINLFLWFRPEWFHWQFMVIALAFAAKEFVRWNKEGRSAHIFNPSAFPLGLAALLLLLTGTWDITLGSFIANTQANPPHMYLVIFLAALPGQLLFGVVRVTMAAVVTLYGLGLLYLAATDTYLFYNAFIPVPVFLGMHLLITDPASSPRTESGRLLFGVLYGFGIFAFELLLSWAGVPTFYDKLLPVPILNLLVGQIDRLAASRPLSALDPSRLGRTLAFGQRNVVYTSAWAGIFILLNAVQAVGDKHPGQSLPFWQAACEAGSTRACNYVAARQRLYCANGSGWACNELGILLAERSAPAYGAFKRGCELGLAPACENLARLATGDGAWARTHPPLQDLPLLLRRKQPIQESDPARLYALACEQGWPGTCEEPPRSGRGAEGQD